MSVRCLGRQEGASQTVQEGQVPTNHRRRQPREGRVGSGSQFEGTAHHGGPISSWWLELEAAGHIVSAVR